MTEETTIERKYEVTVRQIPEVRYYATNEPDPEPDRSKPYVGYRPEIENEEEIPEKDRQTLENLAGKVIASGLIEEGKTFRLRIEQTDKY